jgi:hypothetical protein
MFVVVVVADNLDFDLYYSIQYFDFDSGNYIGY